VALLLCGLPLAGCGGSSSAHTSSRHAAPKAVAERVCAKVRTATASRLGAGVKLRIADSDPSSLQCVLRGKGMRVAVNAQPSAVAYTQFDTTSSHYSQVFGNGGAHNPAEQPVPVTGVGGAAIWVAAQNELVATNASPGQGGVYATVTVTGGSVRQGARILVARDAGRATLASTPGG
jgi:hypothetical protein